MSTILPLPSQVTQFHIQYSYAKLSFLKTDEEGSVLMSVQYGSLFEHVRPALESKIFEFRLYQYNAVTEMDLWNYCIKKKWRKRDIPEMKVYELVNDILEIYPAQYMTHTQIEEQRTSNWFSELNQGDIQSLFKPNVKAVRPSEALPKLSES